MTILQLPSNLGSEFQGVQFIDARNALPVNPQYTWSELAGVRDISALNTLVCHHDAIPKHKTAKYGDIELATRIAIDHINSKKNHPNGDAGFPYDVWIRNGIIYWFNDIEQREYGVASNNGYTVNVCVSGDYYNFDTLTPEDRKALYLAIIMIRQAIPESEHIKGHGQIVPTHCPGYEMKQVREDIATMELKEAVTDTPSDQLAKAFALRTRIEDLYQLAIKEGKFQSEAQRKLGIVSGIMVEQGLL